MPTDDRSLQQKQQAQLVAALRHASAYPHPAERIELMETHISYVLLAGEYAYKIKKAVNLGFLDYTTLMSRRSFCQEELRLNRRTAPALYLGVVPVTGTPEQPRIGDVGEVGEAIEYAVMMHRFPQKSRLDSLLARDALNPAIVDALTVQVADFHASIAVADDKLPFGTPQTIAALTRQNIDQITPLLHDADDLSLLSHHARWLATQHGRLSTLFAQRRSEGFVRECHGDLHLGNIVLIEGCPTLFDCIEFNPEMRWVDVMNEVAFLMMDLQAAGRADLSWRFLDRYLQITGDYAGARLLPYYIAYRAMVRAKVELMRAAQLRLTDAGAVEHARRYLSLANSCTAARRPAIVLTHGFSGSGKSTLSLSLLEILGAIRLRADVERKRLHGIPIQHHTADAVDSGLYAADATHVTYERLSELTTLLAQAGTTVIVDASFLKRWQRELLRNAARRIDAPFLIVHFHADPEHLRDRVAARHASGSDASDADLVILEHQLAAHEPLAADEMQDIITYDTEHSLELAQNVESWQAVLERLGRMPDHAYRTLR